MTDDKRREFKRDKVRREAVSLMGAGALQALDMANIHVLAQEETERAIAEARADERRKAAERLREMARAYGLPSDTLGRVALERAAAAIEAQEADG